MDLLSETEPEKETALQRYRKTHPPITCTVTTELKMVLDLVKGDLSYPKAMAALVEKELDPCLELTKNINFCETFKFCTNNYPLFAKVREMEERRTGKMVGDKQMLVLLYAIYTAVAGDTGVLERAWERIDKSDWERLEEKVEAFECTPDEEAGEIASGPAEPQEPPLDVESVHAKLREALKSNYNRVDFIPLHTFEYLSRRCGVPVAELQQWLENETKKGTK